MYRKKISKRGVCPKWPITRFPSLDGPGWGWTLCDSGRACRSIVLCWDIIYFHVRGGPSQIGPSQMIPKGDTFQILNVHNFYLSGTLI